MNFTCVKTKSFYLIIYIKGRLNYILLIKNHFFPLDTNIIFLENTVSIILYIFIKSHYHSCIECIYEPALNNFRDTHDSIHITV